MDSIHLAEDPYLSINGEGTMIGLPVIFVRTQGCKVGCSWCDSKYTWSKKTDSSKVWSYEELCKKLKEIGSEYPIWWTGGEPLEHWDEIKGYYDWIYQSDEDTIHSTVLITAVPEYIESVMNYVGKLVIDVKLKSAGIKYDQLSIVDKYLKRVNDFNDENEISRYLPYQVELKMVVAPYDLDEAISVIERYPDVNITLQPIYWDEFQFKSAQESIEKERFKMLASSPEGLSMAEWYDIVIPRVKGYDNVRMLPQLHKWIWPNMQRGI